MEVKEIQLDKIKLHTEYFGDISNPACILIAGKMSTGRFWSDNFCQYLVHQVFFVIRYDHRDIGESSEIDWQKEPYTMSDLAKDVISLMESYGIKKAHFIGDSMGGWICQRIGLDYPEKVLSLVIISAGPIEITEKGLMSLTEEEQKILENTSKFFSSIEGNTMEETVQNCLCAWCHLNAEFPLDEEMAKSFTIDFFTRTNNKNGGKNHELMMQEFLSRMKQSNDLQKIEKPVLVIHGDKDPVVLLRHGKAVADAITNSSFVVINGMGHTFFNRELEEKIAKIIINFLNPLRGNFMKLHHFAIQVNDIDRSIKFYTEKLGFKIKTPKSVDRNYFYSNLVLNSDVELEIIQIRGEMIEKRDKPPICPHIALESSDFDKDLQILKEKCVKIFDGPHIIPKDVKIVTILDPDNYRIDIGQLIK